MAIIPKKNEMPVQDPKVRAHNFNEVATGYTEAIALSEADRCLNCKNRPCVAACPVNINIPDFMKEHLISYQNLHRFQLYVVECVHKKLNVKANAQLV